ncbi:MAG TPA: hypothetical protein VHQ86_05275 [Candidatus Saccharimonadia bacterium]|jgi:hypothetical protein|nr:hypothetical protein [Candidatus Saccharimonadia bacterium]
MTADQMPGQDPSIPEFTVTRDVHVAADVLLMIEAQRGGDPKVLAADPDWRGAVERLRQAIRVWTDAYPEPQEDTGDPDEVDLGAVEAEADPTMGRRPDDPDGGVAAKV